MLCICPGAHTNLFYVLWVWTINPAVLGLLWNYHYAKFWSSKPSFLFGILLHVVIYFQCYTLSIWNGWNKSTHNGTLKYLCWTRTLNNLLPVTHWCIYQSLLFSRQPVCGVCTNHEVVMFQPRTVTPPYLGSAINSYLSYSTLINPFRPSPPSAWFPSGGRCLHPPLATLLYNSIFQPHRIILPPGIHLSPY